jgi:hypothetical protein
MHALSIRLSGKRLYIADLAARLEAMESGRTTMNALAYRLYARRMKAVIEGYPAMLLAAQLGRAHPSVLQAIAQQHFEAHGAHAGEAGRQADVAAGRLLRTLTSRRPR